MMKKALTWIGFLFFFTAVTAQEQPAVSDGDNWQLPGWVNETPNAGWAWCNPQMAQQWQNIFPIDAPDDEVYFHHRR